MDKQKEDYEKFFAEQSIHDPDLYKWGALWVFWQAAQSSMQKDYALALEKIATMQVEIDSLHIALEKMTEQALKGIHHE